MMYKNTGVMCMVTYHDPNREDSFAMKDIGNYYEDGKGNKCVFTSERIKKEFGKLADVPVYVYPSK